MDGTITLSKASLVKLFDAVLYPNPDDPGDPNNPWGPYGPVGPIAGPFPLPWRLLLAVLLNPQPLPPIVGPSPDPWRRFVAVAGPHPDPWRSTFLARTVIDQAVAQYRSAEILPTEQSERAFEAVRSSIREFVDDYCGTRPPRWPRPGPWPPTLESAQLHPVDLFVAGAQFQKAAAFDNPLQTDFSAAADQLFETGLRRMENR